MPRGEGVVDSGGVRIHYEEYGLDGPPLVLIHATGFLAALWRPIAERLASRFRVVAIDQRGHGDSDKPADGYSFETFASDLHCVVEALALERPVVVGHSSGGTTIVVHAARYPAVIERAVLIEPILPRVEWYTAPPGGRNANSLAEGARKRRSVWPSPAEMIASYRGRDMFAAWSAEMLQLYVDEGTFEREDGQVELKCPPELEARFFEAVMKMDFWPLVPQLSCPTLVLWGDESHLHERLASQVQEGLPNARTVLVPETTHFLPQERPDDVARLIEEFLAD